MSAFFFENSKKKMKFLGTVIYIIFIIIFILIYDNI